MAIFFTALIIIIASDLFDLIKNKNTKEFIIYFSFIAVVITGGIFYFNNENASSFVSNVLKLLGTKD